MGAATGRGLAGHEPHARVHDAAALRTTHPHVVERTGRSEAACSRSYALAMECYCCGQERDQSMMAALACHDEIKICRICIGWLMQRAGGADVTPTLPVADMDAATRFYEAAGFTVRRYDDGFAFVHLDDQSVFDLDLIADTDPARNGAGCY